MGACVTCSLLTQGAIEVHLIMSGEASGGIGETGATAALAGLGDAMFAATGVRLRRLPVEPIFWSLRSALQGRKLRAVVGDKYR